MSPQDRQKIAESTLEAISTGAYTHNGAHYSLTNSLALSKEKTAYYAPDSFLSQWSTTPGPSETREQETEISLLEITTLEGARLLVSTSHGNDLPPYDDGTQSRGDDITTPLPQMKVGVLNFASAKKPGGGFLRGAQAQEESIARSSTLYPTLMTSASQQFYSLHTNDLKGGYYSHAMIYSPHILVIRDDSGDWVPPFEVDVLTSPAVNAGVARNTLHGKVAGPAEEVKIGKTMKERMARILFLFEKKGIKNIVLGSFGTGVFQNQVELVAAVWAELLVSPGARFQNSFDRVVFAIVGRKTFETFKETFEDRKP